jgi:Flp pilus assembly pilin Flp
MGAYSNDETVLARRYFEYLAASRATREVRGALAGSDLERSWLHVVEMFLRDEPDAGAVMSALLAACPANELVNLGETLIQTWLTAGNHTVVEWLVTNVESDPKLRIALGGVYLSPEMVSDATTALRKYVFAYASE